MTNIVLTSGPRAVGKSTYAKNYCKQNPGTHFLSRDAFALELLGKTTFNPHTGEGSYVEEKFLEEIERKVKDSEGTIIVDMFNGFKNHRQYLINKFHLFGAEKVFCWRFVTPLETNLLWYKQRADMSAYSDNMIRHDYALYARESKHIEKEGFDQVRYVHPLQRELQFLE